MEKRKTQTALVRCSGLQGVFSFEQIPSSPSIPQMQLAYMKGYCIDPRLSVQPIWRRHHD